jgi:hypothetical protein
VCVGAGFCVCGGGGKARAPRVATRTHATHTTSQPPPSLPCRPQQARPPVDPPLRLTDLPNDVLALILSFIPQADRFRVASLSRDLATAARPPSAAWTEITLAGVNVRNTAKFQSLMSNFGRALATIRRLELKPSAETHVSRMVGTLAVAAPHLETLTLDCGSRGASLLAGAQHALTSASRLTHLSLVGKAQVFAPGGCLPGRAWAAAAAPAFMDGRAALGPVTAVAAAAAPTAQLTRAWWVRLEDRDDVADAINAFAAGARHPAQAGQAAVALVPHERRAVSKRTVHM